MRFSSYEEPCQQITRAGTSTRCTDTACGYRESNAECVRIGTTTSPAIEAQTGPPCRLPRRKTFADIRPCRKRHRPLVNRLCQTLNGVVDRKGGNKKTCTVRTELWAIPITGATRAILHPSYSEISCSASRNSEISRAAVLPLVAFPRSDGAPLRSGRV
jgi:hypothetical protein